MPLVFASGLANDGGINVDGGTLEVGALTGTGTITAQSADIVLGGSVSAGQTLYLDPTTTTIKSVASFQGTIYPSGGDTIVIDNATGGSYVGNAFTITELGTVIGTIAAPGYVSSDFLFATNGPNLIITDTQPVCFVAGTRVATPSGDRPVETLQPGDAVIAADAEGGVRSAVVRWVGCRSLDLRAHAQPELVAPVRIRAGAVASDVPARDLLVSPDHCVLMDGHLLRAFRLINGWSVVQERVSAVTYLHVELEEHALLLAEGMLAESYLEEGHRGFFTGVLALPGPMHDRTNMTACAPFAPDDAFAERVWRRVAARAGIAAVPASDARRALHVAAGRRLLRGVAAGERLIFGLPRGTTQIRLVSAHARPTVARPWVEDRRRLGVKVSRIKLDGSRDVPLDQPELGRGWWAPEPGPARWTDGDAHLKVPPDTNWLEVRLAS